MHQIVTSKLLSVGFKYAEDLGAKLSTLMYMSDKQLSKSPQNTFNCWRAMAITRRLVELFQREAMKEAAEAKVRVCP